MSYAKPMVTIELDEYQALKNPKDQSELLEVYNKFAWCLANSRGNVSEAMGHLKNYFGIAITFKPVPTTISMDDVVNEIAITYKKQKL